MAALIVFFAALFTLTTQPADPSTDPVVQQMERVAAPEYREAIDLALELVDPDATHPEWRVELWRICKREAWCGKFGTVTVHAIDGWTGVGAWTHAVRRGSLDPEKCAAHRLKHYDEPLAYLTSVKPRNARHRAKLEALAARIEALPRGTREPEDFATRGGFGMNAARALQHAGECTPPEALDDPMTAAFVAATTLAACRTWDGPKGQRRRRACTCVDHTRRWVGGGSFDSRSLLGRYRAVQRQCGPTVANRYAIEESIAWLAPGSTPT